jgi:hypothetical protein
LAGLLDGLTTMADIESTMDQAWARVDELIAMEIPDFPDDTGDADRADLH